MKTLYQRIAGRLRMTLSHFRSDCHFSLGYAMLRVGNEMGGRIGFSHLSTWAGERKNKWIQSYLDSQLQPVLDKYRDCIELGHPVADAPIWVCWWTGENDAPSLVKQCIRSIRRQAKNHPVYVISQFNFREYVDVPQYMLDKVQNGSMCIAHLSDYLRFSLLEKYGGLWLDATIFCSDEISSCYFDMPVFTCKGGDEKGKYISDNRWTCFCFGGFCGNVLFAYLRDAIALYWKQNQVAIDYLMLDYMLNLGYEKIKAIAECIDLIPENNLNRDDLRAAMNASLPAEKFDEVIVSGTRLHKLSWREQYSRVSINGESSIYNYFLNM